MEVDKIYCGDCLDVMKEIEDKSIDLVLTDPPYGVDLLYDKYVDTEDNWFSLMKVAIPEMQRIGKMVIMPCCRIFRLGWIYANYPPMWLMSWFKGSPGTSSSIGFNDWEPLLVYGKPQKQMHDVLRVQPTPFDNGHPCPKPLAWAEKLITMATNEGDLICDPFLGSGTSAVAAKRTGRHFIGIELSEEYCQIARKRVNAVPQRLDRWAMPE
jgi:DNA modification methylase